VRGVKRREKKDAKNPGRAWRRELAPQSAEQDNGLTSDFAELGGPGEGRDPEEIREISGLGTRLSTTKTADT